MPKPLKVFKLNVTSNITYFGLDHVIKQNIEMAYNYSLKRY